MMKDKKFELNRNAGFVLAIFGVIYLCCTMYGFYKSDSDCVVTMARGFKSYCSEEYGRGVFSLTVNFVLSISALFAGYVVLRKR